MAGRNKYSIKLTSLNHVQQNNAVGNGTASRQPSQGSILSLGKSAGFNFIQDLNI